MSNPRRHHPAHQRVGRKVLLSNKEKDLQKRLKEIERKLKEAMKQIKELFEIVKK